MKWKNNFAIISAVMIALRHDTCFQYEKTGGLRPIIDTFCVLFFVPPSNKVKLIRLIFIPSRFSKLNFHQVDRFLLPRLSLWIFFQSWGLFELSFCRIIGHLVLESLGNVPIMALRILSIFIAVFVRLPFNFIFVISLS